MCGENGQRRGDATRGGGGGEARREEESANEKARQEEGHEGVLHSNSEGGELEREELAHASAEELFGELRDRALGDPCELRTGEEDTVNVMLGGARRRGNADAVEDGMPEFDARAHGCPKDWNEKTKVMYGGTCTIKRDFTRSEWKAQADMTRFAKILGKRIWEDGRPLLELVGEPEDWEDALSLSMEAILRDGVGPGVEDQAGVR